MRRYKYLEKMFEEEMKKVWKDTFILSTNYKLQKYVRQFIN